MPDANPVFNPLDALTQRATQPQSNSSALQDLMAQHSKWQGIGEEQLGRMPRAAETSPEDNESEVLGAMALAAGQRPVMVGGFGQLLATIGGTAAATAAAQRQRAFERERQIAGSLSTLASPLGGAGMATQFAHAALNPGMNVAGVGVVDRLDPANVLVKAPYIKEAEALWGRAYAGALAGGANEQDAQVIAEKAKNDFFNRLGAGVTGGRGPITPSAPGAETAPAPKGDVTAGSWSPSQVTPGAQLTDDQKADALASQLTTIRAEKKRYANNPEVLADLNKKEADLRRQIGSIGAGVTSPAQPERPILPGKVELGRQETTAKETAKDLVEYEKDLTAKNDAASSMLRNLGYISEQAKHANFGAGAEFKTQALKWADTFGVSLSDADKNAMNANQIIGKVALQLATIGAKNISSRPTQLEFEKLLTQGVPAAGMTKEAFLKVLKMFEDTAKAEQGQLSEFMKFKHSMPKGSASSGDFSDYWALRKDPRYHNISIQDILDTMKERNMTFNQVISKLRERK